MNINPQKIHFNIRQVDANLFAGSRPKLRNIRQLKKAGIECVVDLRNQNQFLARFAEKVACFIFGIRYKSFPNKLKEGLPSRDTFSKINEIVTHNNKTYIHCTTGTHRTNLACAASCILRGKKSLQEAIDFILKNNYYTVRSHATKNISAEEMKNLKINMLKKRLYEFKAMFSK